MGRKTAIICPYCTSGRIVRNGHPHSDKLQYFCTSCGRYFSEDTLRGYPPTNIPFPVIAYLLYYRRRTPEFSNMRRFRVFVNHWLRILGISDKGVSRQTIHHWINNFDKLLDDVITFSEARDFINSYTEKIPFYSVVLSYSEALGVLSGRFGREYVVGLIHSDPLFLSDFCRSVGKFGVFSWDIGEKLSSHSRSGGGGL
jgi:DNA-directed RNA polymerase subunit RPC12/RpoP